jgi:hypothetical protein
MLTAQKINEFVRAHSAPICDGCIAHALKSDDAVACIADHRRIGDDVGFHTQACCVLCLQERANGHLRDTAPRLSPPRRADDASAAFFSDQRKCGHAARLVGPSNMTRCRSRECVAVRHGQQGLGALQRLCQDRAARHGEAFRCDGRFGHSSARVSISAPFFWLPAVSPKSVPCARADKSQFQDDCGAIWLLGRQKL